MKEKRLLKALGQVDADYIEEASATQQAKRPSWLKRGAIAACLCVALLAGVLFKIPGSDVTIAPGFLVVTAYAASSDEEITMQEGIELPTDYKWSLAMSSRPGLPLKLSATEYDDLSFEVSVDGGTLLFWESNKITYLGSSFNTGNDTTVYWTNLSRSAMVTSGPGILKSTPANKATHKQAAMAPRFKVPGYSFNGQSQNIHA